MARIAIRIAAMALSLNGAMAEGSPLALSGGSNKLQRAPVTAWQPKRVSFSVGLRDLFLPESRQPGVILTV
jgi:hypothetical protein